MPATQKQIAAATAAFIAAGQKVVQADVPDFEQDEAMGMIKQIADAAGKDAADAVVAAA